MWCRGDLMAGAFVDLIVLNVFTTDRRRIILITSIPYFHLEGVRNKGIRCLHLTESNFVFWFEQLYRWAFGGVRGRAGDDLFNPIFSQLIRGGVQNILNLFICGYAPMGRYVHSNQFNDRLFVLGLICDCIFFCFVPLIHFTFVID